MKNKGSIIATGLILGGLLSNGFAFGNLCTGSIGTGCYKLFDVGDFENIQFDPQPTDVKVMFGPKSDVGKRYEYRPGTNVAGAQGVLSVLMTAISTGTPAYVWIVSGNWFETGTVSVIRDVVLAP